MMEYQTAYNILMCYQQWRRGEGKFAWNDDPEKNEMFPFSPQEIGAAIDTALEALLLQGGDAKEGGAK